MPGVADGGSGKGQKLLLPPRQVGAPLPQLRVIALGKLLNKRVNVGLLGRIHHRFQGIIFPQGDIAFDISGKEKNRLAKLLARRRRSSAWGKSRMSTPSSKMAPC